MMDADAEINAIEAIYKVMGSMDRDTQRRIIAWLEARFEDDQRKRIAPDTGEKRG